jgi:RNA polymerase sigma-70 factor (ECF subfamily)
VTERTDHEAESKLAQLQERLWVLQAQQGNPDAFRSLVDHYERRLLYYLMRFTNNPEHAADTLQEVWVTAFRKLKDLRAPEAFRVWLYQIAHDKIVSHARREVRRQETLVALSNEALPDDSYHDCQFEDAQLVHRALERLSSEHREVLTLRFLEDMKLEEIAETLGCELGTVKSRLHYAKQAVRKFLQESSHE